MSYSEAKPKTEVAEAGEVLTPEQLREDLSAVTGLIMERHNRTEETVGRMPYGSVSAAAYWIAERCHDQKDPKRLTEIVKAEIDSGASKVEGLQDYILYSAGWHLENWEELDHERLQQSEFAIPETLAAPTDEVQNEAIKMEMERIAPEQVSRDLRNVAQYILGKYNKDPDDWEKLPSGSLGQASYWLAQRIHEEEDADTLLGAVHDATIYDWPPELRPIQDEITDGTYRLLGEWDKLDHELYQQSEFAIPETLPEPTKT